MSADPGTAAGAGAQAAVDQLLRAIVARDAEAIVDSYAAQETLHVFVEGPRWQTVGHDNVARGWRHFCTSDLRVTEIAVDDGPRLFAPDDTPVGAIATVSATTRLTYDVVGAAGAREVVFRLTWVLQRGADRWRIVHEHASQPGADPYGTGDWLRQGEA